MDKLDKQRRSWNMSRIKAKDTLLELVAQKFLYKNGIRYQTHNNLPGKPDITITNLKAVIFINGCFWHGHKKCKVFRLPKTNKLFWSDKINKNIKRDARNSRKLKKDGWYVKILWECYLEKDSEKYLTGTLRWINGLRSRESVFHNHLIRYI